MTFFGVEVKPSRTNDRSFAPNGSVAGIVFRETTSSPAGVCVGVVSPGLRFRPTRTAASRDHRRRGRDRGAVGRRPRRSLAMASAAAGAVVDAAAGPDVARPGFAAFIPVGMNPGEATRRRARRRGRSERASSTPLGKHLKFLIFTSRRFSTVSGGDCSSW